MMEGLDAYIAAAREQIAGQRDFFARGPSRDAAFRLAQLRKLENAVKAAEPEILEALHRDLGKSAEEGYLTEAGIVLSEIRTHIRHLRKWMKRRKAGTPLFLFPSKSYVVREPLGIVLILSPWNYPFQLLINPLIGAISAGNCAVLKPSHSSPATNRVIAKIIRSIFPPEYVCVIEGNREQTKALLAEPFDLIFFTGSPTFGKEVMQAAAMHLTPVVLELGGKSPCIVDRGCDLEAAAKRIAWGKLLNAGQTCIAPDYVFVHHSLEQALTDALKRYITEFYGENAAQSPYYPRIIDDNAFQRLKSYLGEGETASGGPSDAKTRYIAPTVLRNVPSGSAVLQAEIFGPILPILTYDRLDEAIGYINERPKPLALYYFGKRETGWEVIRQTTSGGACINDVVMHIANHNLPFGGVGSSGMGKYHGEYSFRAFSNERAVLVARPRPDFPFRYVPFRFFGAVKKLL